MTLHALVTRPEAVAAPVAEALRARGLRVTVEPMLTIRPRPAGALDPTGDLAGVQALLFTSANGVRAFAAQTAERNLPVLTVGDATAAAARAAGFDRVESAAGDVHSLADLVRARLDPEAGSLLHVAGSVVAGDLAGLLAADGFRLRRAVLYEAIPAERLSPAAAAALAEGAFDLVLFFSPRTAETFARLVRDAAGDAAASESSDAGSVESRAERLTAGCARAEAICLSPAVAAAARRLPWRRVRIADRPDLPAMLDLVDTAVAEQTNTIGTRMDRDMDETAERKHAPEEATATEPTATGPTTTEPADPPESPAPPETEMAEARAPEEPDSREPEPLASASYEAGSNAEADRAETPATEAQTTGQGPWAGPDGPAPLPAQRSGGAGLAALAAVVAAAVTLALVLTQPWWSPWLGLQPAPQQVAAPSPAPVAPETANRLAELEQRLGSLAGRLDESDRTLAALADSFAGLREKLAAGNAGAQAALPPEITAAPGRLDALEQRIGDLTARMERAAEPSPEMRATLGDLRTELGALKTDLADLRRELGDVPRLRAQMAAQETAAARRAEEAALMLAAAQLRASLATDRPFATELAALRALAGDEPDFAETIEPLAARAESGIPTLRALQASFPEVARAVAQADQSAVLGAAAPEAGGEEPGWVDRTLARLSSLVTIRPVGGSAEGTTPGARVARAEADLDAGDLRGAVEELSGLSGAAARVADGWLDQARARLAADEAAEKLQTAVLRALSQDGGADAAGADPAAAPAGAAPLAGG